MLVAEHVDEFRVIHRHDRFESVIVGQMAPNIGFRDRDLFDRAAIDLFQESAKWINLFSSGRRVLHHLVEQHGCRQNQDPEQNRFHC
jgi:hypothetical protein